MIVAVLAVAVGGVGIFGMQQINNSGSHMYESIVLPMPNLSSVIETLLTIRIHVREMVMASMTGDFRLVEAEFGNIGSLLPVLDGYMTAYRTSITESELIRLFDEARTVYEVDLVPVVVSIYAASQIADIPTILAALDYCRVYSERILGNFYLCFEKMVNDAHTASVTATELAQLLFNAIIIVLAIALAATMFLAVYISRMISRPMGLLVQAFEKVAVGDLTQRLLDKGKDETAKASKSYNRTMEEFSKMIVSIINQTTELSGVDKDLATNMNHTATAVNKISSNIQNIKERQNAIVSGTHATMDRVVANINNLNSQIENQSSHVSQASSAIEEMVANTRSITETLVKNTSNVKTLMEASEIGRNGLQDVVNDIQEIARESEGLMEINSVMENIASQTNLLSMNAAIEAAHAGDAGKGFAVVADEIRKLAENSGEQSKTISTVLKKIKSSIDKITQSTENVLNKFAAIDSSVKTVAQQEENILNTMEEQELGSRQIIDGISNVNEITRHVRNGASEMLNAAEDVIQESDRLEKATQDITVEMNKMASDVEGINIAILRVNEISGKNHDGIDVLTREVSRFRVK
jgi:methyl-accepting chemotaxis protein